MLAEVNYNHTNEIWISYEEQCQIRENMPKFIGKTDKDLILYANKSGIILKKH